jgi:very-short-patch-repair endonuclease
MYELEILISVAGFIIIAIILWRYGKKKEPLSLNLKKRDRNAKKDSGWRTALNLDKERLRHLYEDCKLDAVDIAMLMDTNPTTVRDYLHKYGIHTRTFSEAMKITNKRKHNVAHSHETRLRLYGRMRVRNPEAFLIHMSEASTAMWADPTYAIPTMKAIAKANYCIISKPQKLLYEIIKMICPDAILNMYVRIKAHNRGVFLDIAIPSLKIDIEYDEPHWHQNKQKDDMRDAKLLALGWKIIRINHDELGRLQHVKPSKVSSFLILTEYFKLEKVI